MKEKLWMMAAILCCGTMGVQAQMAMNTENGKAVRRITFDCEHVNIVYLNRTLDKDVNEATIRWGGLATEVTQEKLQTEPADRTTYDLQGRPVAKEETPQKGVFIVREGNQVRKTINK